MTAAFSIFGFLDHVFCRRISVQRNENGRAALEYFIGDALIDGHGRRLDGYTDGYISLFQALCIGAGYFGGDKGIDIMPSAVLGDQELFITAHRMADDKKHFLRVGTVEDVPDLLADIGVPASQMAVIIEGTAHENDRDAVNGQFMDLSGKDFLAVLKARKNQKRRCVQGLGTDGALIVILHGLRCEACTEYVHFAVESSNPAVHYLKLG